MENERKIEDLKEWEKTMYMKHRRFIENTPPGGTIICDIQKGVHWLETKKSLESTINTYVKKNKAKGIKVSREDVKAQHNIKSLIEPTASRMIQIIEFLEIEMSQND